MVASPQTGKTSSTQNKLVDLSQAHVKHVTILAKGRLQLDAVSAHQLALLRGPSLLVRLISNWCPQGKEGTQSKVAESKGCNHERPSWYL